MKNGDRVEPKCELKEPKELKERTKMQYTK